MDTLATIYNRIARDLAPEQEDLQVDPSLTTHTQIDDTVYHRSEYLGGMASILLELAQREQGTRPKPATSKPQEKPARMPEVSTDPYERSHRKAPRGYGSWAFCPSWAEDRGDYIDFTRFFSGTYTEARKQARQAFYGEPMIVALP